MSSPTPTTSTMNLTEYPPLRFFPKFFLFLNLYANLFLAAALVAALGLWASLYFLGTSLAGIGLALLAGLAMTGGLVEYVVISTRLPAKWKYYRINYKRLQKNGFHVAYFMDEMYEPCMRLLIHDLLRVSGKKDEWPGLVKAWKGNGAGSFEDLMKQRILAGLKDED